MSKKYLWALCACVVLGLPSVQAMENDETDCFLKLPKPIHTIIIEEAFLQKDEKEGFAKVFSWTLISTRWNAIIKNNAQKWVSKYYGIGMENQENFWSFFKGKVFQINKNNTTTELPFSALPDPLEGTFNLSKWSEPWGFSSFEWQAKRRVSLSTGFKKEHNPANVGMLEIAFVLRSIEKAPETTGEPFLDEGTKPLPVYIIYTWGSGDENDSSVRIPLEELHEGQDLISAIGPMRLKQLISETGNGDSNFDSWVISPHRKKIGVRFNSK